MNHWIFQIRKAVIYNIFVLLRSCAMITKPICLIPISLQPNGVNIWYFTLFEPTKFIVWIIYTTTSAYNELGIRKLRCDHYIPPFFVNFYVLTRSIHPYSLQWYNIPFALNPLMTHFYLFWSLWWIWIRGWIRI